MNLNDAAENAFYTALLREKHGAVLKNPRNIKTLCGRSNRSTAGARQLDRVRWRL